MGPSRTSSTVTTRLATSFVIASLVAASCGGSDSSSDGANAETSAGNSNDAAVEQVESDVFDDGSDQSVDPAPDAGSDDSGGALYADQLGENGPDPDSIFAGYRFWRDGVRLSESLPGEWKGIVDNPLLEDGQVLVRQSLSSGTGGRLVQRGIVSTDYDSAWMRNGPNELIRARFDSTELETILVEEFVPSGGLAALDGDSDALYLVVNSDTGTKANFIIELDPVTGEERRRVDLSTVATLLLSIDINDTHIVVSRARDEVVVVERATLAVAYTLEVTEGENSPAPFLTSDEIYVVSPGRGDQVDLLSRYSLADGSQLEADRQLPYAGTNQAFGDIVVHSNADLPDMEMFGLSPAAEELLAALPDDINEIHDVHVGEQLIVVGGDGPIDPETNDQLGIFFIDRATNTMVWTLPNYVTRFGMDIAPPPGS